jgi:hypothetical protein
MTSSIRYRARGVIAIQFAGHGEQTAVLIRSQSSALSDLTCTKRVVTSPSQ